MESKAIPLSGFPQVDPSIKTKDEKKSCSTEAQVAQNVRSQEQAGSKTSNDLNKTPVQELDAEERLRRRQERLEKWRSERAERESKQAAAQKENSETATALKKDKEVVEKGPVGTTFKFTLKRPLKTQALTLDKPKFAEFEEEVKDSAEGTKRKIIKLSSLKRTKDEGFGSKTRKSSPLVNSNDDGKDPFESYMLNVDSEVMRINNSDKVAGKRDDLMTDSETFGSNIGAESKNTGSIMTNDDDGLDLVNPSEDLIEFARKKAAAKRRDLALIDHSTIQYEPFRKDFLIEPPAIANMTPEEVSARRLSLGVIKICGSKCPKPVEKWTQLGLPAGAAEVIKSILKFPEPTAIQAQAIPAIMAGRDVIGIAKTGSGKTLAFILPMFRHIKDQRPLKSQEGPIALIMTPTRELAMQINKDCKYFTKALNMRSVCCYGGSHIKEQIAELKRVTEIVIGTPGRIIDLLCANNGRVMNLRRVTYLVLDEADRMFDMGFEPQVMRIVLNIRPDRQNVLFSATFPKKMEALARKILTKPLEITVGGRSVVAAGIEQIVEVRTDDTKFLRLLEILGQISKKDIEAKVLIFVDRQEAADMLMSNLFQRGYPCQSLHGGKDQADRDSTILDFKSGDINILVATSVAARGLDVKNLKVVLNYDCPNHMEDYIHRVGRTGRAGLKGLAYTFITPSQDRHAVDIVKALVASNATVPPELQELSDKFMGKVKAGEASLSSYGFGGKGLEKLEQERDIVKMIQKKAHRDAYADEDEDDTPYPSSLIADSEMKKISSAAAYGFHPKEEPQSFTTEQQTTKKLETPSLAKPPGAPTTKDSSTPTNGALKAREIIAEINARLKDPLAGAPAQSAAKIPQINFPKTQGDEKKQGSDSAFSCELEINDYPQKARWRVTNKEQISQITEISGAAITTRGTFFGPGKQPGPNERKLYLFIEGENQLVVDKAKAEIKRIITEAIIASIENEATGTRYSVV